MESFEKWKTSYVHSYRKAHRAYYQKLTELETDLDALKPKARALVKMNTIVELGPPLPITSTVATDLAAVEKRLYVCPDAEEAPVDGADADLPKVLMDTCASAACRRGCKTEGAGRLRPCRQIPAIQGCSHWRDLEEGSRKGRPSRPRQTTWRSCS